MTTRYISASERSTNLCHGVSLLGSRNHVAIGSAKFEELDMAWTMWAKRWPELEAKAREMQAEAFDFCITL